MKFTYYLVLIFALEPMYILAIPVTDITTFLSSLLFLSLAFLIYPIYRSAMCLNGMATVQWDAPYPQILAIIHLAGIRRPQSYLLLSHYTPIDSRNANLLEG